MAGDDAHVKDQARAFWGPLVDTRFSGIPARNTTTAGSWADAELEVLDEIVIRARKLRNRRVGTGRLPSDVLASIFLLVRDGWPPSRLFKNGQVRFCSGWMSLTHVSSQWRDVSLGAPSLWAKHSDVLDTPLEYLPLVLSRSKRHPLEIVVDIEESSMQADIELGRGRTQEYDEGLFNLAQGWLCQSVALRARDLSIGGCNFAVLETLASIAPHLSNLRQLCISSWENTPLELPAPLANLSHLEILATTAMYTEWTSPIFSDHLTKLDLTFSDEWLRERERLISFEELHALMGRMQSLQHLDLTDLIPIGPSQEIRLPSSTQIFTYKTEAYYSSDRFAQSLRLLANIKCSATCTRFMRLCLYGGVNTLSDMERALVEHCLRTTTTFQSCTTREIYLYSKGVSALAVEGDIIMWSPVSLPQPFTHAMHYGSYHGPHLSHLDINGLNMRGFLDAMNIEETRVATLPRRLFLEHPAFVQLSLRTPALQRLGFSLSNSSVLLHSMMDTLDGRFTVFPLLEIIVLHGIDETNANDADFIPELTALVGLVHLRKDEGAPLREIVISKTAGAWGIWGSLREEITITFA
ncbi:unnamed protein product [Peniophora sp. CBMAI 1063]|nr:unnamed protein product [Peniophora sp. CBMAI 1063]